MRHPPADRFLTFGGLAAVLVGAFLSGRTPAFAAENEDYVGAEACGTCHEVEYQQWKRTGHAQSLSRLSSVQQRDKTCRNCHTMLPLSESASLVGVQCESCHGAGRLYAQRYVMKDKVLARLLGLEEVQKDSCSNCHTADGPNVEAFKFEEKLELVRHRPTNKGRAEAAPAGVHDVKPRLLGPGSGEAGPPHFEPLRGSARAVSTAGAGAVHSVRAAP